MKIIATWMTLEELDGADTRREYKGWDGQFPVSQFKYWQPFGLHFHYPHQVDDHNNRRYAPISLDRTWRSKFQLDRNFELYLDVTEMNTELSDGHINKGRKLIPNLQLRRKVAHDMTEKKLGQTLWIMGGLRGQHVCQLLFLASLVWSKTKKGATTKRQTNSKNSNRNIKIRDTPTLNLQPMDQKFL